MRVCGRRGRRGHLATRGRGKQGMGPQEGEDQSASDWTKGRTVDALIEWVWIWLGWEGVGGKRR